MSKQTTTLSPTHPPLPLFGPVWRWATDPRTLSFVLLSCVLVWGGTLMIKLWSPNAVTSLQPWLYLLTIAGLTGTLLARLVGAAFPRLFGWTILAAIGVEIAGSIFGLTALKQLTKQLHQLLDACLAFCQTGGQELLAGFAFFILLARLLERLSWLWFPQLPPQPDEATQQAVLAPPSDTNANIKSDDVKQLFARFGTPTSPDDTTLCLERGRSTLYGEIWIVLGLLMAVGSVLGAPLLPSTMTWSKVAMGVAPWLLVGALLQLGQPFTLAIAWQHQQQWYLWIHAKQPTPELQRLLDGFQRLPGNNIEETQKAPDDSGADTNNNEVGEE